MAKVFITGSADGLGLMAAKTLVAEGHQVVLHARNEERAEHARKAVPGGDAVLIADLSHAGETKRLAEDVNSFGQFDAIIHNAGVYQVSNSLIFRVNTLAPYILSSLILPPKRLVYLSSSMHLQSRLTYDNLSLDENNCSYSDSKLHVILLSKATARRWPSVYSNALDPGWVPTKMGGRGATGDLEKGMQTQVWLAVSNDANAKVSGRYFYHQQERNCAAIAGDEEMQEKFLLGCEKITGITLK